MDTTGSVLSIVFSDLAAHPDVQARCRTEILEVIGHRNPTHDDLKDLKSVTLLCVVFGVFLLVSRCVF